MTSRTIPPLLEPYLSFPPEASLVILTSVLGASTNWLVLRHLHALLKPASHSLSHSHSHSTRPSPPPTSSASPLSSAASARVAAAPPPRSAAATSNPANSNPTAGNENGEDEKEEVAILLLSFLRDLPFWRENLARLGIDLENAARKGKFGYVDGLGGGLFSTPSNQPQHHQQQQQQQRQLGSQGWKRTLTSAKPGDILRVVSEGVEQLKRGGGAAAGSGGGDGKGRERKVVLVVDGLDFVLAALDPNSTAGRGEGSGTAMALKDMLMELREKTHAAIVTLAADDPLIKEQETTLEKQHAWFALSLAHEADTVLSLRLLDTGAAKDVSGVIRITHGRARADNHEYLYHVGGDGGVRVFERGQ